MPRDCEEILCFGRDEILLDTRQKLLERSGYAVLSTMSLLILKEHLLREDVGILVLCNSATNADIEAISMIYSMTKSTVPILYLSAGRRTVLEFANTRLTALRVLSPRWAGFIEKRMA